MKKILSLVLAMLMIISMVPAVFAADASESDYQTAIDFLKAIELYKGTSEGDAADELVERYQMALFTARMVTGRVDTAYWETDANDSGFTDVDALNAEALGGVCYAAQQGIVNGIGGSEFAPFDNVTYRDAIVMIVRALGFNYPTSGYPWSYINKARELGVLDGITGVTYTAEVKREVIAQLLYNALNAEIAGATLAETAFGVAETIVMVTATEQLVYTAGATKSIKSGMVRVAAVDVEGEPMGTEYYVPYKELGAKNINQANELVGTTLKLTHKNNFSEFLAYESLSQVFENTVEKKEVTVASGKISFNKDSYVILGKNAEYSSITNNQGTLSGSNEIKVYKAFGATKAGLASSEYVLAANGNIYAVSNPFEPYAIYSTLVDKWFKVVTNNITTDIVIDGDTLEEVLEGLIVTTPNKTYEVMTDAEVAELLNLVNPQVEGFSRIGADAYINTRIASNYGVPYDYYKAIASDIDGDGDFDRVTIRQYELFQIVKKTVKKPVNGTNTDIPYFQAISYTAPVNSTTFDPETHVVASEWGAAAIYDNATDYFRFTGKSLSSVPNGAFVVAYMSDDGIGYEKEMDIVEIIGGAKKDENDNAYAFNAYIRGYDATTNSVIFGSNYETLPFGYFGVVNTTAYAPTECVAKYAASWYAGTANYVRQFWNKYATLYVLNGRVIFIEEVSDADDYVILDSFTDFTDNGLKAMAYSTVAGGLAEITISELNGWNLGGFDYELFMLLKQMEDLGLDVKDYPLPVELKHVYKVRYVAEDGSYNLIEAGTPYAEDKDVYVNNFGYILGVDKDGVFGSANRVATNDKDLWIILQGDKIHMFKGKLSTVELMDLDFYKAADNQFVAVADATTNLGPILGNVNEGVDYWVYNELVDKYYNQNYFSQFVYGHYMTNMRTGAVEFITYDSELAYDLFNGLKIVMEEGAIYQATNKVLKSVTTYGMKNVADTEFATGEYNGKKYQVVAVGAGLPADLDYTHPALPADLSAHYDSYTALRQAIALNMYEVIYDRDFTNDPTSTDVYAAIEKELMAKVTFIDRVDGKRTSWKGYDTTNKVFTAKTIGSDTTYVTAYVMYDYADMSATVFFDSDGATTLTSETESTMTVGGVTADVVHASNVLKNETIVTVTFPSFMSITDITIDGEYTDLVVKMSSVSYKVADASYTGTPAITATVAAKVTTALKAGNPSNLKNQDGTDMTNGLLNYFVNYGTPDRMYDGVFTTTTLADYAFAPKAKSFNYKLKSDLTFGEYNANREGTEPYWSAVITELETATDLTGYRVAWYKQTNLLPNGIDILVSADGKTWTVAGSLEDMVAAGHWTLVDGGENDDYYVAEFWLDNAKSVKYVALAVTELSDNSWGNRQYNNIIEIELYN